MLPVIAKLLSAIKKAPPDLPEGAFFIVITELLFGITISSNS